MNINRPSPRSACSLPFVRTKKSTNSYRSSLHRAVQLAKDSRITTLLLTRGGDLSTLTIDRKTPLHTFFNPVLEQIILSHSTSSEDNPLIFEDFLTPDRRGRTLLHYLAWSSKTSPKTFDSVRSRGSDTTVGALDSEGKSVLHFAAQRGNAKLIAHLLSSCPTSSRQNCGLDINHRDHNGKTPLHYAVESRRAKETVEVLLGSGAEIGARDREGRSPLMRARERGNLGALEALGDAGVKLEIESRKEECMDDAGNGLRRSKQGLCDRLRQHLGFERCWVDRHHLCAFFYGMGGWISKRLAYERVLLRAMGVGIVVFVVVGLVGWCS